MPFCMNSEKDLAITTHFWPSWVTAVQSWRQSAIIKRSQRRSSFKRLPDIRGNCYIAYKSWKYLPCPPFSLVSSADWQHTPQADIICARLAAKYVPACANMLAQNTPSRNSITPQVRSPQRFPCSHCGHLGYLPYGAWYQARAERERTMPAWMDFLLIKILKAPCGQVCSKTITESFLGLPWTLLVNEQEC